MGIGFAGIKEEVDWELLQTRFPSIAFALSCDFYPSANCFISSKGFLNARTEKGTLHSEDLEKELSDWKESLSLEGIDLLYIYGVGCGHYYQALLPWLKKQKERRLLFLEEDLGVLKALFSQEIGKEMLEDPQVHFYYKPKEASWDFVIEECVQKWVSDRIEWTSLRSYFLGQEKKLRALRLQLLRRSASVHAKVGEALHYPVLMENLLTSFCQIPNSFHANKLRGAFKNVPAIICGAGRSLAKAAPELKALEQKALIIAGGSAITALSHYQIRPHLCMALDPNEEEYFRLKNLSCFETPFIYSSRLHKDVLSSTHLQMGYLCSNTGGLLEDWMHEKLGLGFDGFGNQLGDEALSVTTLAVAFAKELGCRPILFCGVDLSYSDMQRYAAGVLPSSRVFLEELQMEKKSRERFVRRKNREGKFVYTLVKWVMEAACIGAYAKKHPDLPFFNVSNEGLPIPGVQTLSVEEFTSLYCQNSYDLRGKIQAEIAEASLSHISQEKIFAEFKTLQLSFEETLPLFKQMIEEIEAQGSSWKMDLLDMDLKEQPAYEVCLALAFLVYQRILDWWYPDPVLKEGEEKKLHLLEKKRHLWLQGEKMAKQCISLLKKF
jgi:hypothetical protein